MRIETLISLCKMYSREGGSLQDQLDDVVDGESMEDLNPNALKVIREFMLKAARYEVDGAEDLAELIHDHLTDLSNARKAA